MVITPIPVRQHRTSCTANRAWGDPGFGTIGASDPSPGRVAALARGWPSTFVRTQGILFAELCCWGAGVCSATPPWAVGCCRSPSASASARTGIHVGCHRWGWGRRRSDRDLVASGNGLDSAPVFLVVADSEVLRKVFNALDSANTATTLMSGKPAHAPPPVPARPHRCTAKASGHPPSSLYRYICCTVYLVVVQNALVSMQILTYSAITSRSGNLAPHAFGQMRSAVDTNCSSRTA